MKTYPPVERVPELDAQIAELPENVLKYYAALERERMRAWRASNIAKSKAKRREVKAAKPRPTRDSRRNRYKKLIAGEKVSVRKPQSRVEDRRYVPAAMRHWRLTHDLTPEQAQVRIGLCNPLEAPIFMADLSFKALGAIEVGDVVVGWGMPNVYSRATLYSMPDSEQLSLEGGRQGFLTQTLMPATVLAINELQRPMVRVYFASGRELRCSPDHLWLQHYTQRLGYAHRGDENRRSKAKGKRRDHFTEPVVGRLLCRVVDIPEPIRPEQERLAGWLAGIFDGEGHVDHSKVAISQSRTHNPALCAEIERALVQLGFRYTVTPGQQRPDGRWAADLFALRGGRQTLVDFVNRIQPTRRENIERVALGRQFRTPDEVLAVEPDVPDIARALTTTTGNYVAWGYASKNSPRSCSWRHYEDGYMAPPYRTLLKVIAATGMGTMLERPEIKGESDPDLLLERIHADYTRSRKARARRRRRLGGSPVS